MAPHVKFGRNIDPTKPAMIGEREVLPIVYPMVMGFDRMAHLLHPGLMKVQRSLKLSTLMNQAIKLFLDKVVKNGVKGGVQIHSHGYTPW